MRLINADHLISIIKEYIKREDSYISIGNNSILAKGIKRGLQEAVRTINKEPTVMQWIPCSEETGEGYPTEDGYYYVTEQNYGFYLDADYKQRVTHTSHFKNGDFTDRFYTENNSNITAWMPLPEPWKGEE